LLFENNSQQRIFFCCNCKRQYANMH